MSWRTPTENENGLLLATRSKGSSFRHVSGRNPGVISRTGPPTKAFGGDGFEAFLFNGALFS